MTGLVLLCVALVALAVIVIVLVTNGPGGPDNFVAP